MDFLHLKCLDKSSLLSLVRMPGFEVVLFAIVEVLSSDRDLAVRANPLNDSALTLRFGNATGLLRVSAGPRQVDFIWVSGSHCFTECN